MYRVRRRGTLRAVSLVQVNLKCPHFFAHERGFGASRALEIRDKERNPMRQCGATDRWVFAVLVTAAVGVVACGESTDSPTSPSAASGLLDGGGATDPGGTGSPSSGVLTVRLTDSPYSAAQAALVRFSDVSVHLTGSGWVPLSDPFVERTCDLKRLEDGAVDDLVGAELTAGHTQIRLTVEAATLYANEAGGVEPCDAVGTG